MIIDFIILIYPNNNSKTEKKSIIAQFVMSILILFMWSIELGISLFIEKILLDAIGNVLSVYFWIVILILNIKQLILNEKIDLLNNPRKHK